MQLFAGTSGFAYKEWKGTFYPEDLPQAKMLPFYGERFNSVEINNTFYRMPNAEVLAKWTEEVPPHFRFVLKAPQRITHIKRLKADVAPDVTYFYQVAEALGDRVGPTLFQLPPNMKKDLARLEAFLALLPAGKRVAFEFRHPSWFEDGELQAVLQKHGAALCLSDIEEEEEEEAPPDREAKKKRKKEPVPPQPLVPTAEFGFLRLRRCDYDGAALDVWADKIRAQPWREVYVFFKHEDEGTGPKLAADFVKRFQGAPG